MNEIKDVIYVGDGGLCEYGMTIGKSYPELITGECGEYIAVPIDGWFRYIDCEYFITIDEYRDEVMNDILK